ncbi:hypothetical protein AB0C33_14925 [Nonomuraea sp. NPDC048881]
MTENLYTSTREKVEGKPVLTIADSPPKVYGGDQRVIVDTRLASR